MSAVEAFGAELDIEDTGFVQVNKGQVSAVLTADCSSRGHRLCASEQGAGETLLSSGLQTARMWYRKIRQLAGDLACAAVLVVHGNAPAVPAGAYHRLPFQHASTHPALQATRRHDAFVWLDGQCDYKYIIHTAGFSYSGGEWLAGWLGQGPAWSSIASWHGLPHRQRAVDEHSKAGGHACPCLEVPAQRLGGTAVISAPDPQCSCLPLPHPAGLKYKLACGSLVFKFSSPYVVRALQCCCVLFPPLLWQLPYAKLPCYTCHAAAPASAPPCSHPASTCSCLST